TDNPGPPRPGRYGVGGSGNPAVHRRMAISLARQPMSSPFPEDTPSRGRRIPSMRHATRRTEHPMPTEATTLDLDLARQVLAAQPFARLVGTELTEFGDGAATLIIEIQPEHGQQFGFVHGGVLAYAADNALTFAAGTVLGPNV